MPEQPQVDAAAQALLGEWLEHPSRANKARLLDNAPHGNIRKCATACLNATPGTARAQHATLENAATLTRTLNRDWATLPPETLTATVSATREQLDAAAEALFEADTASRPLARTLTEQPATIRAEYVRLAVLALTAAGEGR